MTKRTNIFNPYLIFFAVWITSLLVYQLAWSDLLPNLSIELLAFFIISLFFALIFGKIFQQLRFIEYHPVNYNKSLTILFWFIIGLWSIQFYYSDIPALAIIQGREYNYMEFGIPSVKVFITTFTGFFSTYSFHIYLSTRRKKVLIYYLVSLSFFLLAFSRGMLMMTLSSSVFLLLIKFKTIRFKQLIGIIIFLIIGSYIFGYLGNVRLSNSTYTANNLPVVYDEDIILELAKANANFYNCGIPKKYMWTYVYIASPIGNLQYSITYTEHQELSVFKLLKFINNELLYDFISKRINKFFTFQDLKSLLIVDNFTVSTVFSGSYTQLGWSGMVLMMLFILGFPILFLGLIHRSNPLYLTAAATLNSVYVFLFFDNMFTFSGLSLQLLYPLLLGPFIRKTLTISKFQTLLVKPQKMSL